jgi:hypothetical protein
MTQRNDHAHAHTHATETTNMNTPTNDNRRAVATTAKGSTALTSLEALGTALNNVDTGVGHSTKPMLLYKSRNDVWTYGQSPVEPEEGSRWGVNPSTFERGYVAFHGKQKLGERMLFVGLPEINPAELPDVGAPWQRQMSVEMKCLDGADAGVEVVYKANTEGGLSAVLELIEQVRDRINSKQHGDDVVPIVLLSKTGYDHRLYGWIGKPLLTVVGWMSQSGPAPVPAPASPHPASPSPATTAAPVSPPPASPSPATTAAEQPRRRRVGVV